MIRHNTARELAYAWHGGQWSPLYAFASSGIVEDLQALLTEIRRNAVESLQSGRIKDAEQCDKLYTYVKCKLSLDLLSGNHIAKWSNS